MKVYIVLGYYGEYDDSYTKVEGVYSSKEAAEEICENQEKWFNKYNSKKYTEGYNDIQSALDEYWFNRYPELNEVDTNNKDFKIKYNKTVDDAWTEYPFNNVNIFIKTIQDNHINENFTEEELKNMFIFYEHNYSYEHPVFQVEEHNVI